mmetsp:Transcript_32355/g.50609  ORF Transcript_32355/g.50609 Transcript_32355/m.50609 type:complete len:246 (-) Transcript_32355:336-1073(-)|eukprot:CAMPEP_0201525398 /NCGR_PEP_ID=MMETSP0161_2-20130828/28095_1 /ASSEMBLY_ACC=CAM_ASM_000251 /TAXON_ID=180227 /ORGANISM="Neoparamoeba aestuarina, Strain SoJaBio B1-5/56/2" /LENGTH=245 /DNA_ID=CAMNT_0047925299 /DNA_START=50 /DNA_END=787 /DNA_ORIENTATION=+
MSSAPALGEVPPSQTLYVSNLREKVKKEELKKALYQIFSQFGPILDVVALKTAKMRGQAFVVFKDIGAASNALREMQGFPFFDRPLRIAYAKTKSDAVLKAEGTYEEDRNRRIEKRKAMKAAVDAKNRQGGSGEPPEKRAKTDDSSDAPAAAPAPSPSPTGGLKPQQAPPNKILFVENLPPSCNELALQTLFKTFGLKDVSFLPGQVGKAFVEFENEAQAGQALNSLQNFKVTNDHLMVISYAKK